MVILRTLIYSLPLAPFVCIADLWLGGGARDGVGRWSGW